MLRTSEGMIRFFEMSGRLAQVRPEFHEQHDRSVRG